MSNQNLDYVCSILTWIENNPSRNAKLEGLKTLKNAGGEIELIAKNFFSAALDWYRIYHLGTLPEINESNCEKSPKTFLDFLAIVRELEGGEYLKRFGRDTTRIMDVLAGFNAATALWLRRCLLKDLDCGVQSTTVNKVWPGLIRTFECQLADVITDIEALKYPLLLEPKIDGVRALAFVTPDGVTFMSRGGKVLSNVAHIGEELQRLLSKSHRMDKFGIVIDGELFTKSLWATKSVVSSSVSTPKQELFENLKFHAFDAVGINSWKAQKCEMPQSLRTLFIQQALDDSSLVIPVPSREIRTSADVESHYNLALAQGYEGVMLKSISGMYAFDRTSDWRKYKPHEIDPFEVTGYYEGEGRLVGSLGGFIVKMKNGDTCRVGGGFSDVQRSEFFMDPTSVIGKRIKIKYKEITPDGKLREPVFFGLE